jgi:hypothetical protein
MSHLIEHDIECTYCQHPNTVEVWSVINVDLDPELKDLLLGGELNIAECEACHKTFYAEHFLLYHDPGAELMAFVYPLVNELQRDEYEKQTQANFETSQALAGEAERLPYPAVTLFGLDSLLRLVEREDEEVLQAEIAGHLAKEHGWPTVALKRSVARRLQLPPLVLRPAALESLLKVNDRLSVYQELLARVKTNPALLADLPA